MMFINPSVFFKGKNVDVARPTVSMARRVAVTCFALTIRSRYAEENWQIW